MLWLVVPLLGCVDTERIYVEVGAAALAGIAATVLVCFGLAAAWRRRKGTKRSNTFVARLVSWTFIALACVILSVATLGLLRVAFVGRPLALTGYFWLYASPLLWAAILAYEAHQRKHALALRVTAWVTLVYLLLFSATSLTFWPGPRLPSAPVVEIAVSSQGVCERFENGEVVCRGEQQGVPGRWPIPVEAPRASDVYLVDGRACLRTSSSPSELWCWTHVNPRRQEATLDPEKPTQAPWTSGHQVLQNALDEADAASAGPNRACLIEDGHVHCAMQPADPSMTPSLSLIQELSPAEHVVVSAGPVCSWVGPVVRCVGEHVAGEFRLESNVENITVGRSHACALAGGSVACWGLGRDGRLGTGAENQAAPEPVELRDVAQLAGTGAFTCARTRGEDAATFCWGIAPSGVRYDEEPEPVPNRRFFDVLRRQFFRSRPTRLRQ